MRFIPNFKGFDFFPHRVARALDLCRAQHHHEQGGEAGDDEVEAGAELQGDPREARS